MSRNRPGVSPGEGSSHLRSTGRRRTRFTGSRRKLRRRLSAGVLPVVAVAHALESALGRGERGMIVRGWIAMLSEAVGCGQTDARTGHVFLAAGAMRLGG